MRSPLPEQSAPAIAVFYPGNSLMHQVSNWAIRYPAYDFTLCFAQSLHEIRSVLRRTAITIVDATEDPAWAVTAFTQALAALEADCVTVYTETMHEGLELFVRVRGAPLLFGPIGDTPWEEQLARMVRSAGRLQPGGFLAQRHTEADGGPPPAWLRKHRLQTSLTRRLLKFFQERR
jgi:hypothetical protein